MLVAAGPMGAQRCMVYKVEGNCRLMAQLRYHY